MPGGIGKRGGWVGGMVVWGQEKMGVGGKLLGKSGKMVEIGVGKCDFLEKPGRNVEKCRIFFVRNGRMLTFAP